MGRKKSNKRKLHPAAQQRAAGRGSSSSRSGKSGGSQRSSHREREVREPVQPVGPADRFTAWQLALAAGLIGAMVWSFWPNILRLTETWDTQPDYSHGFLVVPLALCILWCRRDRFPHTLKPSLAGVLLVLLAVGLRLGGALYYIDAVDDWSLIVALIGCAWAVGGGGFALWTMPGLLFLFFMVPLPFRAERLLSFPLQTAATNISEWMLQCLGQPALAEGHVIWLGEHRLEVEEACSGLRIFIGVAALAYAWVAIARRSWWENVLMVLCLPVVALLANAIRIVVTGLLFQYASSEAAEKFSHDMAGWLMIPLAAGMFIAFGWYLRRIVPEVKVLDMRQLVREENQS